MTSRIIQAGIFSKKSEKKEKLLRKVTVKIRLKRGNNKDGITMEVLLDSGVTELVMSLEFSRKNKIKKLDIYKKHRWYLQS